MDTKGEFYLGRILTELKLVPEERLREALEIQSRAPDRKRVDTALNPPAFEMRLIFSRIKLFPTPVKRSCISLFMCLMSQRNRSALSATISTISGSA